MGLPPGWTDSYLPTSSLTDVEVGARRTKRVIDGFSPVFAIPVVMGGMGQLIVLAERLADRSRPGPGHPSAFFFDLNCPFSYLAAERVERILGDVEWIPATSTLLGGHNGRSRPRYAGEPKSVRSSCDSRSSGQTASRRPGHPRCGRRHMRPRPAPAHALRWLQAGLRSAADSTSQIQRSWPRPLRRRGCRWRNVSPPRATPSGTYHCTRLPGGWWRAACASCRPFGSGTGGSAANGRWSRPERWPGLTAAGWRRPAETSRPGG